MKIHDVSWKNVSGENTRSFFKWATIMISKVLSSTEHSEVGAAGGFLWDFKKILKV